MISDKASTSGSCSEEMPALFENGLTVWWRPWAGCPYPPCYPAAFVALSSFTRTAMVSLTA